MSESAYAYFRVVADDLPLDEITSRMGLAPTESWHKGDPGVYNPSRPNAGWCLFSPLPRTELVLSRHIKALLPLLEARALVVRELSQRFETWFVCVGYYAHSSPGLGFSAQEIRSLAALGVGLDCDLYIDPEYGLP